MDHRATLETPADQKDTHAIDQAVFTSIRSPMGQGYRLIASSPGISAAEKKEITRCAPSHGSLCSDEQNAWGFSSYLLGSGRRCVMLSRHAGIETTARGGERVYTNIAVFDPEDYARFDNNPFRARDALLQTLANEPLLKAESRLSPLRVRVDRCYALLRSTTPEQNDISQLAHILAHLLEDRPLVVVGLPDPEKCLRWTFEAIPWGLRQRLSFSVGLKYAPARSFQMVACTHCPQNTRETLDHERIQVLDWVASQQDVETSFRKWVEFVSAQWQGGNHKRVAERADQLKEDCTPVALGRVLDLHNDLARLGTADDATLSELREKYKEAYPQSPFQRELITRIREALA